MQTTCPRCGAIYEVPERIAASARSLRCARCGETWTPETATVTTEAPAAPPVPVMAEAEKAPPAAETAPALRALLQNPAPLDTPRRARWTVAAAWAASLLFLAFCGWAAVSGRQQVMRAWPPSARVYAALGFVTR